MTTSSSVLKGFMDPGFFCVPGPGEGGVLAAHACNSKSIHGIEMKFGRVVENHKKINLV